MRGRKVRWVITALVALGVAFVAAGGPAAAKHFINGGDIAPGTVGGRQIANGAISVRKLSRRARRALAGRAGSRGATGATGATGPQGPAGARGPAGAYNFVDRTGAVVGQVFGYYIGVYPEVKIASGAVVVFDNDPTTANALQLIGSLYYQQALCAGPAFIPPGLPPELAVIVDSPAAPGSQLYVADLSTAPQSFTAASVRTASGCAASSTRLTGAFQAKTAGTVPAVVKPLQQVPAG
jgi:hypothetical protein